MNDAPSAADEPFRFHPGSFSGRSAAVNRQALAAAVGCDLDDLARWLPEFVKVGAVEQTSVDEADLFHLLDMGRAREIVSRSYESTSKHPADPQQFILLGPPETLSPPLRLATSDLGL